MHSTFHGVDNGTGARALRAVALSALLLIALVPSARGQGAEAVTWARANSCASIRAYLAQYPSGRYVSEARTALRAKNCPDPEAEARRRAEREAADRVRLENETRDLRDRLAREEAARKAAETRAADEARKRVAAETTANAAKQKASAAPAASGPSLSVLHPEVRAAAERARQSESFASSAAARARSAAQQAEARGISTPTSGLGIYLATQAQFAGDKYAGNFSQGNFAGDGVYTNAQNPNNAVADILRYEGEWVAGKRGGYGVIYWRNGRVSAGAYQNGIREGYGVYTLNGSRYEGAWRADKPNGYGVLWSPSGNVDRAGIWTDDVLTTPLSASSR